MEFIAQRRYNMNQRSQMQGGKNWILTEEINANLFFWDSHWLEIWKIHLCPYGYGLRARIPRGVSITDGRSKPDFALDMVWPMSSSATSTRSQSGSCMGRWIPFKPVWTTFYPPTIMECRLCLWPQVREKSFSSFLMQRWQDGRGGGDSFTFPSQVQVENNHHSLICGDTNHAALEMQIKSKKIFFLSVLY